MDDFKYLSDYYDRFVGADYKKIADYIDQKLKTTGCHGKYGVDLGCGSGTLTLLLSELGYDMIGIDRSEAMLSRAFDKKPENSTVLFSQQDLTDFELFGPADFMVSTLDCINYFKSLDQVNDFFTHCAVHLKDNGILIFDMNTLHKYEQILGDNTFIYETDEAFCVWENEFVNPKMYFDLTYFIQNDSGSYDRAEDHQEQTYFSVNEVTGLLSENGFSVIEIEDDYECCPQGEQTQRIVITAQKRSN